MTSSFTPPTPLQTAVLFLVFNRPDTAAQVFEAIRHAKPPRLYVACDGPREGREGEAERVAKVREISTQVDWPCDVKTLFRRSNLGCKYAVSGAITWFFEQEEQGIILEDDCLPSQSFFWFCEELLNKYVADDRISIITGYNKQQTWFADKYDYFFSNFGGIWGWATWRRAWQHYDSEMMDLESMCQNGLFERQMGRKLGNLRRTQLQKAKANNLNGAISSWAYPWALTRHKYQTLACVPSRSLIKNIGDGPSATHTTTLSDGLVELHEMNFPMKVNNHIIPDCEYDFLFIRSKGIIERLVRRCARLINICK